MRSDLERFDAGLLVALAVLAAFIPLTLSGYEIKLATTITIQAGLAAALGFVVGPGGLISVGHAAFYGLAAYLFAMIAPANEPANLLGTAFISILGAMLLAAVVGAVSIRSRGLYFILMTLAFGQLGYHFFHDSGVGGTADGTYINFRPELRLPGLDISVEKPVRFYVLVYVVVVAVVALCWWLKRSAFGSLLVAARDNEARVRAFGFSPYLMRLFAFIVSGAMAGAMGYLTAAQHGFVAPQMLSWHLSATALVMVLLGGKDTVSGPVIGAVVLLVAEDILQRRTEHWLVGVGLLIVVVVIAAPQGIVPYAVRIVAPHANRLREWAGLVARDAHAVYLASRDPRVPWYAKATAIGVAAYALSPIDLIPDFIPVLGFLDDVVIVPLGILLAVRMIPPALMAEHRATAAVTALPRRTVHVVVGLWIILGVAVALIAYRLMS